MSLRDYELTFILSTSLDEEGQASSIERVNSLIGAGRGSVTEVHAWGRRHLAYPIAHQRDGFYVTTRFSIPPEAVGTFENDLRLNESILRHILVRQDEVPLRPLIPSAATTPAARAPEPQVADVELDESLDPDLVPAADE